MMNNLKPGQLVIAPVEKLKSPKTQEEDDNHIRINHSQPNMAICYWEAKQDQFLIFDKVEMVKIEKPGFISVEEMEEMFFEQPTQITKYWFYWLGENYERVWLSEKDMLKVIPL